MIYIYIWGSSLSKTTRKTRLKHKGQPPLNKQNLEWTVSWIVLGE